MKRIHIILGIIIIISVCGFIHFKSKNANQSKNTNINMNQANIKEKNNKKNASKIIEELEANPEYNPNGFLMYIEDVFTSENGISVSGKIGKGTVKLNDEVQIVKSNNEVKKAKVVAIIGFRAGGFSATEGDIVAVVLEGIKRNDVERGNVLAKKNEPEKSEPKGPRFEAEIYMLTKEENKMRLASPLYNGDKALFCFEKTNIVGTINVLDKNGMVAPGDTAKLVITLDTPVVLEIGTEFEFKDPSQTMGKGKVTKIY